MVSLILFRCGGALETRNASKVFECGITKPNNHILPVIPVISSLKSLRFIY